jgi:steroid 5-alpha reductase family enzyme
MGAVTAAAAALVAAAMLGLWLVSLRLRDASIVDAFWGPAFALVAWTGVAVAGPSPRALLAAALASAWGLRLGLHLARRRRGAGEDRRYAALRAAHGARFPVVSLFTVFLLQAALVVTVSLPLQAVAAAGAARPLGALDAAAVAVFAAGLACEAIADAQLARFLAGPAGRTGVMDRGLWRYTRHPNYFGDFLVWWGLGLLGAAAGAPWTLAGPAVMTVLLLRISGVTLLEATIGSRRPGYAGYVARTSAFVPWPPRRVSRAAAAPAGRSSR